MSAERIAELERLLAESRQQADEARKQTDEARKQVDEARKQADEARKRTDETKVQVDEARKQADEAKLRAEREAEARRDAQAFAVNLQKRLAHIEHQTQDPQTLRDYLRQISRLHLHLSRLLPFLPESRQLAAVRQASATATERARGRSSESSPKTTTAGTTSIHGKYYPLRVRPWTDYARENADAFGSLVERLGDNAVFPPQGHVHVAEGMLLRRLPSSFADTESFHNHARTSAFLDLALEDPSSTVVEKYFAAPANGGTPVAVFFDNVTQAARSMTSPQSGTQDESAIAAPEEVTGSSSLDALSEPTESDAASDAPGASVPKQTRPDCVVMVRDLVTGSTAPIPPPRRLLVGEHKPCHSMRAADVGNSGTVLPEDCLIRIAIAFSNRKANKTSGRSNSHVKRPLPPKLTFFAHALAQTYHYMLMSGLEYGYLASGETLTFLRIPHDESTTLLYHTSFFPAVDPKDLPLADSRPVYPSNVTNIPAEPVGDNSNDRDSLAAIAVAQLSSLALLAHASTPRSPSWVSKAMRRLAKFPRLPSSYRRASASPLGVRRRDDENDDDDDDDDDDDGNGGGGGGSGNAGRRGRSRRRRAFPPETPGGNVVAPSPLRQVHDQQHSSHDAGEWESSGVGQDTADATADLPYCTQACLLGLVRGLPLDPACPNLAVHKHAAAVETPGTLDQLPGHEDEPRHAITRAQLCEKIQEQIYLRPENGCTNLYDQGLRGSVGCLLKLTVLGYGYTFVAKGVEEGHAYRLRRESRIYRHLHPLQGTLIPVYLGCLRLRSEYPFMARFTTLSHVLLLSYTGETLHSGDALEAQSAWLGRDLEREIQDTYDALFEWGLDDWDLTVTNATWCAETQRVVKIDFDHCRLDTAVCAAKAKAAAAEEGPCVAASAASATTLQLAPMTPTSDLVVVSAAESGGEGTNGGDGGGDGAVGGKRDPATKRGIGEAGETGREKRARRHS